MAVATETSVPDLSKALFRIGDWLVDPRANRIERGEEVRLLRSKSMELLLLLANNAGAVVLRDEIVETVWSGNAFVAAKGITNTVWNLRQMLGDTAETPRYIETIAKRGYRLLVAAELIEVPAAISAGTISVTTRTPETEALSESLPSSLNHIDSAKGTLPSRPNPGFSFRGALLVSVFLLALSFIAYSISHSSASVPPSAVPTAATANAQLLFRTANAEEGSITVAPDKHRYAYVSRTGLHEPNTIFMRTLEVNAPAIQLLKSNDPIGGIAWHPTGERLALSRRTEANGCLLEVLVLADLSVSSVGNCGFLGNIRWSVDGGWIASTFKTDGRSGIALISAADGKLRPLVVTPSDAVDYVGDFSPVGDKLSFVRRFADGNNVLMETDLNGLQRELWSAEKRLLEPTMHWVHESQILLAISPDGGTSQIVSFDISRRQADPLGFQGVSPRLIADGRLLYVHTNVQIEIASFDLEAGVLDAEHSIRRAGFSGQPRFGENGMFAFTAFENGAWEIFLNDGSYESLMLTKLGSDAGLPSLSADSRKLAFIGVCGELKVTKLCILDRDNNQLRSVDLGEGLYGLPQWLHDDTELFVPVSEISTGATRLVTYNLERQTVQEFPGLPFAQQVLLDKHGEKVFWSSARQDGLFVRDLLSMNSRVLVENLPAGTLTWTLSNGGVYFLKKAKDGNWFSYIADLAGTIRSSVPLGKLKLLSAPIAVNQSGSRMLLPRLSAYEVDPVLAVVSKGS